MSELVWWGDVASSVSTVSPELLAAVEDLHREVDRHVGALEGVHAERLRCRRGCADCCVDDLTVFEVEAARIVRGHPALLENEAPRPRGACAMLDEDGACRVYAHRPYVCRTQGLPLRWLEGDANDVVELRDICVLNETETPITEIPEEQCWTLGLFEGRLAELQRRHDGGALRRVALRELFKGA